MLSLLLYWLQLVQTNPVRCIPPRHVTQNHRVPFVKPFQHLDGIHRGSTYLDRNTDSPFSVRIHAEKADGAVLVAKGGPAYVENILHSFKIDRAVNAQVGTRAIGQIAN